MESNQFGPKKLDRFDAWKMAERCMILVSVRELVTISRRMG